MHRLNPSEARNLGVAKAGGVMTRPSSPIPFVTKQLGEDHDVLAPDGSEIRLLVGTAGCSMAHGSLPPGQVSRAIVHRSVEEVWYVTEGRGQVWRKLGDHEEVVEVEPGSALTIPVGAHFQFRTVGQEPFRFVMWTMPPWPGHDEAVRVADYWPVIDTTTRD
jgi:mannose-6-phosphate isomerase-like protein (cupin superfamily)